MSFRIDPHVHSHYSGDGISSPESIILSAKRAGLHGIALTDHNTCDGCRYLLDKGWMREDGEPVHGFLVIPGVEVSTAEGHLLCLGVWLPNGLKGIPAREAIAMVRAQNGVAIPAHPYDKMRAGIRETHLDELAMDALEVFNAATALDRHNQSARAYALRRGIPMTAGSDAHHHRAVGRSYTVFPAETLSVPSILGSLSNGTSLHCAPLGPLESMRKTFFNWFRFRKKRSYFGAAGRGVPPGGRAASTGGVGAGV